MPEIQLPKPLAHQAKVLNHGARFKLWRAGRRTGKSRAELLAGFAGHGPKRARKGVLQGGDVVWFAPDYKQSQAIWREEIRPRFAGVERVNVSESERIVSIDGLGSLQLLSAENIDAARGRKLDGALLDEGAYFDLEYAWNAVIRPALADREGWAFFGSTTNSGHDGNPAKRIPSYFNLLCERADRHELGADWQTFHNTTRDNPRIPRAEIDALYREYPADSPIAAQELDAALGVLGGRYYQIDLDVHRIPRSKLPDQLPLHWEYWLAHDWGYAHWAVTGLFAKDTQGVIYLLDSTWIRRAQDDEIARDMHRLITDTGLTGRVRAGVGGHDIKHRVTHHGAPGISAQDVYGQCGLWFDLADNDKVNGGRAVRRALAIRDGEAGVYFVDTPGNRRVLSQLAEILPDPNDVNKPLKVDANADGLGGDDGADMLRYGLATQVPMATEPAKHVDPWHHGQDMRTFEPYDENTDANPEPIGELSYGF